MANDNLSGVLCTAFLAREIKKIKNLKWSYRIIFVPETIGAIAYCKINEKKIKQEQKSISRKREKTLLGVKWLSGKLMR